MTAQLGVVDRILDRMVREREQTRRTIHAQCKLTPSESAELDDFVAYWRENGLLITRSSAIRAMILEGLRPFKEHA